MKPCHCQVVNCYSIVLEDTSCLKQSHCRVQSRRKCLHWCVSWMLLHVFSVARGSVTAVCLTLCMSTFIGLMFRSELRINVWRWCITVCMRRLLGTWLTTTPVSDIASRRHLRFASRRHLLVLRHNLSTYDRRAFSVAGPAAWNSLCDELHEPSLAAVSFRQLLETRLFAEY